MKRKTIGIIVAVLVLAFAGGIGWSLRDLPQKRLLTSAEDIVFTDVDSAARALERVDTTMLTESAQMRYDLMRAFIHEERWHLGYADTHILLMTLRKHCQFYSLGISLHLMISL